MPVAALVSARDNAAPLPQVLDPAAISQSLKPGERLTITDKDGVIDATKTGQDTYQSTSKSISGVVGGTLSVASKFVNGGVGTDPTVSALLATQSTFSTLSSLSLVPSAASNFFANNFYPAFRIAAPVLSGIKLANTYKMSKALEKEDTNPKEGAIAKFFKNGKIGSLLVDGAHFALDVVCAAAVLGAVAHLAPLAIMSLPVALGLGFSGDVVAGVFHGVGAAASLSDQANGATFPQRVKNFLSTQSGTAMFQRVFHGKEPLLDPAPTNS